MRISDWSSDVCSSDLSSGGAPKKLVLLLHGFGSSGTDMISLAPQWQGALPDTLFLAPHAPQRCGTMGAGYQWWGLYGRAEERSVGSEWVSTATYRGSAYNSQNKKSISINMPIQ